MWSSLSFQVTLGEGGEVNDFFLLTLLILAYFKLVNILKHIEGEENNRFFFFFVEIKFCMSLILS